MNRSELKINRPICSQTKLVKSTALKIGDRFIHKDYNTLCFKLAIKPTDNRYLCSTEGGNVFWLEGNEKVERLNGVAGNLAYLSMEFIKEFKLQKLLREQGIRPTFLN